MCTLARKKEDSEFRIPYDRVRKAGCPDDLEQFSEAFIQALQKAERAGANGEVRARV